MTSQTVTAFAELDAHNQQHPTTTDPIVETEVETEVIVS